MAKKKAEKSLEQLLEEALVKEGEQPYEVPGNWVWVYTGAAHEIVTGTTPPKKNPDYYGNYMPFVKPNDLKQQENLMFSLENLSVEGVKVSRVIPKNSTLLCCIASIGKAAYTNVDCTTNQQINSLIPDSSLVGPLYTYYNVISLQYQKQLLEKASATTVPIINKSKTKTLHFPLPPLLEQKRIVKKLSSMLGKLKETRELIQEARDTFEERRAAILNKAFTGELTKKWRQENPDVESAEKHLQKSYEAVKDQYEKNCLDCKSKGIRKPRQPEILRYFSQDKIRDLSEMGLNGWCETDFVNFCILQRGFDLPINKRTKGKYPVVSSSGIIDYHIESKVKGPGFTVGRSGSVGKIYYVEEDYWPLNTTLFSKELNGNDPKYAFYCLSTFDFGRYSSSTAVPTLNRNNFSDALIIVPPLEEQKEIVRILEKLLNHEDEANALIELEEHIDLMEKSILSKVFRGELGTNDTNDEPAIELLKRSLKEKMNK